MLFTKRDLVKIIVPLMIEQALAVTIGMLDSVMVSTAGESAVSGVSLVDSLNLLLVYIFSALAGGGAVVISQLLGRRDLESARESSKQLVWVVGVVSTLIAVLSLVFRFTILNLVFGKIEPDVMANASVYFLYTAMSYPFLGLYNAGAAVFRAMGDSKTSMYTSLVMNLLNVGGNALLIFVFNMGAAGAAIATLFSRIVGAIVMLVLLKNKKRELFLDRIFHYKPNFKLIKRICGIGIPNGIENGIFQLGKVITQSFVSGFGTIAIASNAVANSLTSLQYVPGTAIGLGMIVVVGRCIGAEEKMEAKRYARKLLFVTYCSIWVITAILCGFSDQIVGLYSLSTEATGLAKEIIFFHSIFVCTIWPIAFTLPNSFRAASDIKYTMILSVASMWVFRVGLSFVLGVLLNFGVWGIWIAMTCDWIFRAVMFLIRYLRGTWLKKYVYIE